MNPVTAGLELVNRAYKLKNSRLLPRRHPVLRYLDAVETVGFQLSHRSNSRDPEDSTGLYARLVEEAHAADRSIADSLQANDSIGDFLSIFGERSSARPLDVDAQGCPCGSPTAVYRRLGRLDMIPNTIQVICERCGDIENALEGAPSIRMYGPQRIDRGATTEFTVAVTSHAKVRAVVGIGLRNSLNAEINPGPQLVSLHPGESRRIAFSVRASPSTRAQAEYALPFAVADIQFSVGRFHLQVH